MKRSTLYTVDGFDVLLFETGETLAFGHDPETGCYAPMESHAAQSAIKTAQGWQIADAANAAADADAQSVLDEQNSNYYAGLGVRQ